MTYSYTQLASYLRCPRSHRYRYLDGWREKETRAAMALGRCFEQALAAYFCDGDCSATLFKEWGTYRDTPFGYKKGETADASGTQSQTSDICPWQDRRDPALGTKDVFMNGTCDSWIWAAISAKSGRDSIGAWRKCNHLTISSRGVFQTPAERPITSWPFTKI